MTIQSVAFDTTPRVGLQVIPDCWAYAEPLIDCDWDRADFRIWNGRALYPALAANVEVTGRTIRWTTGLIRPFVRVRITFVGDGEPNQMTGGRMYLDGKS